MASSYVVEEVYLSAGYFGDILTNFRSPSREDFLALDLACPDSIDHISSMSTMGEILNLNGFSND